MRPLRVALGPGESPNAIALVGPAGGELFEACAVVVGVVEAWRDGAAEQRELAVCDEARTLPGSGGDKHLDVLTRLQIVSKG